MQYDHEPGCCRVFRQWCSGFISFSQTDSLWCTNWMILQEHVSFCCGLCGCFAGLCLLISPSSTRHFSWVPAEGRWIIAASVLVANCLRSAGPQRKQALQRKSFIFAASRWEGGRPKRLWFPFLGIFSAWLETSTGLTLAVYGSGSRFSMCYE